MSPATIEDLKKELQKLPPKKLLELTLKLARFKKENKELLTFLLFESGNIEGYVQSLQMEIDEMVADIHKAPSAVVKKQLRRVTRLITRQSKYIASKPATAELHLHFCLALKNHPESLLNITSANTIYQQQLNKLSKLVPTLDDDLQYDLQQKIDALENKAEEPPKRKFKFFRRL